MSNKNQSNEPCDLRDVATKSFFLGPQAENGAWFESLVHEVLERWLSWRRDLYPEDGCAIASHDQGDFHFRERQNLFRLLALDLSQRFESEIPKFSPRYLGHMFSEISLPALIGHWIATLHNPNNISSESAPVGVEIEKEAIRELCRMAGLPGQALGHFTSCGSIANFESMLRARDRIQVWLSAALARSQADGSPFDPFAASHIGWDRFFSEHGARIQRNPHQEPLDPIELALRVSKTTGTDYFGPLLLVPESRHYSWNKAAHLLGVGTKNIWPVAMDRHGTMKPSALKERIEQAAREHRPIAMVMSILGTTELGNLDPVHEVQDALDGYRSQEGWHLWHHVDAAYGGFFLSLRNSTEAFLAPRGQLALQAVGRVNSVTIDPHKLGYVPYACGAFLCAEPRDYTTRSFDSPYIQYLKDKEPGPSTIEGSRSASGAAATWLTLKAIGSDASGYGRIVGRTIRLREQLTESLKEIGPEIRILPSLDTNVLCFTVARDGAPLSEANRWVQAFYDGHSGTRASFFVSKTALALSKYEELARDFFSGWDPKVDSDQLHLIRLTLMNPFIRSKEMKMQVIDEFARDVAIHCGKTSPSSR